MTTQVINTEHQAENGCRLGAKLIQAGELVAFPTETVYGLGANGLDSDAVNKLYEAKGRPADNPLILHVSKKSDVKQLWYDVPQRAKQLMDAFWPGPLTLIYQKSDIVPYKTTAGLNTVAVRMPDHKTALTLIRACGLPIAAPSANISGRPSPTTAAHVLEDMNGRIPLILDGGPCRVGLESTVLNLASKVPTILRPGGVTHEMLSNIIGDVEIAKSVLSPVEEAESVASPGMKYKHYAPDAQVIVVTGDILEGAKRISRMYNIARVQGKSCAILTTAQTKSYFKGKITLEIGDMNKPETLCANLFSAFRQLSGKVDIIFTQSLPTDNEGLAYMNRLLRAAGFETVKA